MKTSLIHLSPSADWRAAMARIRGGPQGRVILVWPSKGGPRSPRAVLRLMQRRSLRLGVPLAVVASSTYIRSESARLGLPQFTNTRQARKGEWGLSSPTDSWRSVTRQSRVGSPALRSNAQDLRTLSSKRRAKALL